MLILVLNISGINDPRRLKRKRLLKKVNQLEVEVLCLLETRVKQPNASPIVKKWFSDWSWLENYCDAENGRVWQLWKNNWQVSQVDVSSQLFTAAMILWKEDLFGAGQSSRYLENLIGFSSTHRVTKQVSFLCGAYGPCYIRSLSRGINTGGSCV
ncbi:hypothetical protein V6N13_012137 [Hibiscus sabdariffa]